MKKSSKTPGKGTLKKDKEQISKSLEKKEYKKAKELSYKFIDTYPNNIFGYVSLLDALTHNYGKYLKQDELKEVKEIYNNALDIASKSQKNELKTKLDEYMYDIKEVDNLSKIRLDITSKFFLKRLNDNTLSFINQNLNTLNSYGKKGIRIKNGYDFIKGLFYLICLIYNLFHLNLFLIITIPFGIFGIITMYSFIEMNFFKKGKYKLEKKELDKLIKIVNDKTNILKQENIKYDEAIDFLNEQKVSSINKLPYTFIDDLGDIISNDEKATSDSIINLFLENDLVKFNLALENNTNLSSGDVVEKLEKSLKNDDDEVFNFINSKILEKKNKQSEALLMKKITTSNIIISIFLLTLSIFSLSVVINNFYDLNIYAFVIALIVGFLSILFYNIDTGKHNSLSDSFSDNIIGTIFNSSLIYVLIYDTKVGNISFVYGFLQIPITFCLIFVGFTYFISLLKYNYLFKKLRK